MKRVIVIIAVLLIAVVVLFVGIHQIKKAQVELPKSIGQLQEEKGVPVEVSRVRTGTFTLSRTYLGTVEGGLQGDVLASIMEKIVDIPVKVGDRVKKGDIVCQLDTKAAIAQYNQAELAFKDAQRDAERMKKLYEAGAISQQMLEKVELGRDIAEQNLKSSSDVVTLTTPISGVVTDVFYHIGETTGMGEPVVRIADLSRIKVKFPVNHEDRKRIKTDTPAFLRINGDGEMEIPAAISEVSLSADPKSRLFNVWVVAENYNELLHPGLLVDVRLEIIRKSGVTLLPRNAILTRNEQVGVFTVSDNNRAKFTLLELGLENSSEIEVLEGLTPGQTIVINGQNNLSDGKLVNIVEL